MSTIITHQQSEREQIVLLRRQAVFMFIASHLDADGCFSGSDRYIANTVAGSNRHSISRALQSLEDTGDVMVVEQDRRDAKGSKLPNRVCPVPIRTFWVREWIRAGSKTAEDLVTLSPTREHGQSAASRAWVNPNNDAGIPSQTGVPVSMAETHAHEHKNNTLYRESPFTASITQESKSVERIISSREHGHAIQSKHRLDLPIKQVLARLRKELSKTLSQQKASPHNPYWGKKVKEIEAEVALLEGRQ